MNFIEAVQGSEEWLAIRAKHFTASEAPAMMGVSKHMGRSELLRQKYTGLVPDVAPYKHDLFARGHAAEAAARPLVEAHIGDELYPATGTLEVDGLPLLASFDGVNMTGNLLWESKLWNADLAAAIECKRVEAHYWAQLEQQLLVSGADRVYFTTTDGTSEKLVGMWYESLPERRAALIAGWRQFAADLAAYQHVEAIPEPTAAPVMSLPAIVYRLNGLALTSNLDEYRVAAEALVERSKKKLETDQDFSDQDAMNKSFKEAEERIAMVCEQVIGEIKDVDAFNRELSHVGELIRQARLNGEKQVKARKDDIRSEILNAGAVALREHIDGLNKRIGKSHYMPMIQSDFPGAMRGKKTFASLREAVNNELIRCKILASETADCIQINLSSLRDLADGFQSLFPDTATIVLKANDDLVALIKTRIADHKDAESRRAERELSDRLMAEAAAARVAEAAVRAIDRPCVDLPSAATALAVQAGIDIPAAAIAITVSGAVQPTVLRQQPVHIAAQADTDRPTDGQIIGVLAAHYKIQRHVAIQWLLDMDMQTVMSMEFLTASRK